MLIRRFIQKNPALRYFALTVDWSYLYWQLLFTIIPLDPVKGPTLQHILFTAVGGSPSLFGILLTYLTGGKEYLRDLFSRLSRWRVGLTWYAAALLLVPGLNAVTYVLYGRLGGISR